MNDQVPNFITAIDYSGFGYMTKYSIINCDKTIGIISRTLKINNDNYQISDKVVTCNNLLLQEDIFPKSSKLYSHDDFKFFCVINIIRNI